MSVYLYVCFGYCVARKTSERKRKYKQKVISQVRVREKKSWESRIERERRIVFVSFSLDAPQLISVG